MYNCATTGAPDETNNVFGCGKYGLDVSSQGSGSCLPFNRLIGAGPIGAGGFAGFYACGGYSEINTLVHDGDHGGWHTNPDVSFIALLF